MKINLVSKKGSMPIKKGSFILSIFFTLTISIFLIGCLPVERAPQPVPQPAPQDICKAIYSSIGIFLKLADHEWRKTKDEKKALLYSQAAANYSVAYETVCRKE